METSDSQNITPVYQHLSMISKLINLSSFGDGIDKGFYTAYSSEVYMYKWDITFLFHQNSMLFSFFRDRQVHLVECIDVYTI